MFSSNQTIKVSGELNKEDVLNVLTFAIKCYGENIFTRKEKPVPLAYQECEDGTYCIGVAHDKGWTEFPFSYDLDIVASIICNKLSNQKVKDFGYDGSYSKGFIMENIEDSLDSEENGIKNPFWGIVSFRPFTCFYAK